MIFSKKSLGQNYLIDKNIINKIISIVEIKNKNIIEIGPGKGALTDEILKKKPKSLTLIEKDYHLFEKLKNKFINNKSIKIYNDDILKLNLEKVAIKNSIVFGNLPYNISSQILVKMIKFKKWPPKFNNLIFMFQKELGEKIISNYPSPGYGRLSILTSYRLEILKKFFISPNCFFPKPKITSMVIHFQPKNNEVFNIKEISNLEKITNIFFSNKRKMINKTLHKLFDKDKIKTIKGLKDNLRPSDIKPDFYYKITELYEAN
jgi:16S rRNA (adenine1518-N6/adenine1519-N6)-dimethyltransferase